MNQPTSNNHENDLDDVSRWIAEAGDPSIEPRPEHVEHLRALLLDRLGPRADSRLTAWIPARPLAGGCLLPDRGGSGNLQLAGPTRKCLGKRRQGPAGKALDSHCEPRPQRSPSGILDQPDFSDPGLKVRSRPASTAVPSSMI